MKTLKKYLSVFLVLIALILSLAIFQPVLANSFEKGLTNAATTAGYNGENKIFPKDNIGATIAIMVKALLSVVGILFLGLMIYGGFIWMNARGNETETRKAQDIIRNTIIGIAIVLTAYTITTLVTNIWNKTSSSNVSPEDNMHYGGR